MLDNDLFKGFQTFEGYVQELKAKLEQEIVPSLEGFPVIARAAGIDSETGRVAGLVRHRLDVAQIGMSSAAIPNISRIAALHVLTSAFSDSLTSSLVAANTRLGSFPSRFSEGVTKLSSVLDNMPSLLDSHFLEVAERAKEVFVRLPRFELGISREQLKRLVREHGEDLSVSQANQADRLVNALGNLKTIRRRAKLSRYVSMARHFLSLAGSKKLALAVSRALLGLPEQVVSPVLAATLLRLPGLHTLLERSPPPPKHLKLIPKAVPNAPGF